MSAEDRMDEEQRITLSESVRILSGEKKPALLGPLCKGFTPRSIEVPWAASHVRAGSRVLDVGFALANLDYLGMLLHSIGHYGVRLDAVDIIRPEQVKNRYPEEWLPAIAKVPVFAGDVRTLDLPADTYDAVMCISTLEHIGYDRPSSTVAGSAFERAKSKGEANTLRDPHTHEAVLNAFWKTLKPGGIACISVPMGKGEPIVTQDSKGLYSVEWEYESESWRELTGDPRFELHEELFFKNTPEGWMQVASPAALADVTGSMNSKGGVGFALCVLAKK